MSEALKRIKSYEGAPGLIDILLEERKLRQTPKRIRATRKHLSATDIADFVFCPASFAVKNTFEIPVTEEMDTGTILHEKRHLLGFLDNVRAKRVREHDPQKNADKDAWVNRGAYGDLLSSDLVFSGHTEDVRPFFSKNGKLAGLPDYIFKRSNGTEFIVEEKHSWQDVINKPWRTNVVQVLCYLYGIDGREFDKGYLMYFSWYWDYGNLRTKNARLFTVFKSQENRSLVAKKFLSTLKLKEQGKVPFNTEYLYAAKCAGCSCRALCNHKTGRRSELQFPYI